METDPSATALARSVSCVDVEGQQPVPTVREQVTCRHGTDRLYILLFTTAAARDDYLRHGQPVVAAGFNLIGGSWLVHTATEVVAQQLRTQLPGQVQPAA